MKTTFCCSLTELYLVIKKKKRQMGTHFKSIAQDKIDQILLANPLVRNIRRAQPEGLLRVLPSKLLIFE